MRLRKTLILAGVVVCIATAQSAWAGAGNIVRWTDADGMTHFTNPQFAPPGLSSVTPVEVIPANVMDVPAVAQTRELRTRFVKIDKKDKSNLRGFRGHSKGSGRTRGNRRYR
jgi:hypothetical protein